MTEQKKAATKAAKEAEAGREAAVEAAKASPTGEPEDQASTSGESPVKDPDRAPYGTAASLGYRPHTDVRMAKDPNEAPPENDRKWATATRARWGETTPAELLAEQREIDENERKARR